MRVAIISLTTTQSRDQLVSSLINAGLEPVELQLGCPVPAVSGYVIVGDVFSDIDYNSSIACFLREENKLGKPMLGIQQGAYFLMCTGLVPGLEDDQVGVKLDLNESEPFSHDAYLELAKDYQYNAFTRYLEGQAGQLKVVSARGRIVVPPALLLEMQIQGMTLLQYCDDNSAGSAIRLAAISNKRGNVLAMVPEINYQLLGERLFRSMRRYIEKGYVDQVAPLYFQPRS